MKRIVYSILYSVCIMLVIYALIPKMEDWKTLVVWAAFGVLWNPVCKKLVDIICEEQ